MIASFFFFYHIHLAGQVLARIGFPHFLFHKDRYPLITKEKLPSTDARIQLGNSSTPDWPVVGPLLEYDYIRSLSALSLSITLLLLPISLLPRILSLLQEQRERETEGKRKIYHDLLELSTIIVKQSLQNITSLVFASHLSSYAFRSNSQPHQTAQRCQQAHKESNKRTNTKKSLNASQSPSRPINTKHLSF